MTNLTRREHRQQAIWRAKEAYALYRLYNRKVRGFQRTGPATLVGSNQPFQHTGYRYVWQGWEVTLNLKGKLIAAYSPKTDYRKEQDDNA